jgi:hypothetical protein
LTISCASEGGGGTGGAGGGASNSDPIVEFAVSADSFDEAGSPMLVDVRLSFSNGAGALSENLKVTIADSELGSATAGQDYTSIGIQEVFFSKDDPEGTLVSFAIFPIDDLDYEGTETIQLEIQSVEGPQTAMIGAQGSMVASIIDDDQPSIGFESGQSQVTEDGSDLLVWLQLDTTGVLTIPYTEKVVQQGGTAYLGSDYFFKEQFVTFQPGDTSGTKRPCILSSLPDDLIEGAETIILGLENPNQARVSHVVKILDDEKATVEFATSESTTPELDSLHFVSAQISIEPGKTLEKELRFDFEDTGLGTATPGADYESFGTIEVFFPPFSVSGSTASVGIQLIDDLDPEDSETIQLELSNLPSHASAGNISDHAITVEDDDLGMLITSVDFGRVAVVTDINGKIVQEDLFIRSDLLPDGISYNLDWSTAFQSDVLQVLKEEGTPEFQSLFEAAQVIPPSDVLEIRGPDGVPPFSMVPKNAALRIHFDREVDPTSLSPDSLIVMDSSDWANGLQEMIDGRRFVQNNSETGLGAVILDTTTTNYPLGLLDSPNSEYGNITLYMPTRTTDVLRGLDGAAIGISTTGPQWFDPQNGLPVAVRSFRSGNENDPYAGFLPDITPPGILGELDVDILWLEKSGGDYRTISYAFSIRECAEVQPKIGDIFQVGDSLLVTTEILSDWIGDHRVKALRLEGTIESSTTPQPGNYTTRYTSADELVQVCYLHFNPAPVSLPASGVGLSSDVTIRFTEPILPQSVRPIEAFSALTYLLDPPQPGPNPTQEEIDAWAARPFDSALETAGEYLDRQLGWQLSGTGSGRLQFGEVQGSSNQESFTLAPNAGFSNSHGEGSDTLFSIVLRDGAEGVLDLAGNPGDFVGFAPGNAGQDALITLDSANQSVWSSDRYFALRFQSRDENGDSHPDFDGQYRLGLGSLRGRATQRFSRNADSSNQWVRDGSQSQLGLISPLSQYGSVTQTALSYPMLGMGADMFSTDELNLDIESMSWAPFEGTVYDDTFNEYMVSLAHSKSSPDHYVNPFSGYPELPNSGLQRNQVFDENILGWDDSGSPPYNEVDVFPKAAYGIQASDLFFSNSGTPLLPWPDFLESYTWRDTSIPTEDSLDGSAILGGRSGGPIPPAFMSGDPNSGIWQANEHPSIAAPLLMRFRCWPDGTALGTNSFQTQLMCSSSSLPAYRVFSTGTLNNEVIPDVPFTGGSSPINHDPSLYWHQVDFVVRVSRVHTHWFAVQGGAAEIGNQLQVLSEELSLGSSITLEFRASELVENTNCLGVGPLETTVVLDNYGEILPVNFGGCGTVQIPTPWTSDPSIWQSQSGYPLLNFVQLRFTFASNIEIGEEPALDAVGFTWSP